MKPIDIKIPSSELNYLVNRGLNMFKKIVRRLRIKKVFKENHLIELYKWIIYSYNSCIFTDLKNINLRNLVLSGILICVDENQDDQGVDTMRRIRMNPQLFKSIIF